MSPSGVKEPQEAAGGSTGMSKTSTWNAQELGEAVHRMARHAPLISTAVDLHTSAGINRFRAAARTVLNQIQDRSYRYSWPFFKRHEATRRLFVAAYAVKMRFDRANESWGTTLSGTKEADETFLTLLNEVSSAARPLWAALARLEYRKTIIHL